MASTASTTTMLEPVAPFEKKKQQTGGVTFSATKPVFEEIIGKSGHARLLLHAPDGAQIFHEAGIHLHSHNVVVLSSNRMQGCGGQQSAYIIHVPLDAIPKNCTSLSRRKQTFALSNREQEKFWTCLTIEKELSTPMAMPNGASRWRTREGSEAVLWCEQGRHNVKAPMGCKGDLHSALVSYTLDGECLVELDNFHGKPFSSLNDANLHEATGTVFFTDPDYGVEQLFKRGLRSECTGVKKDIACYAPNGVYCWQPTSGRVKLLDTNFVKPNGCTFLPDPNEPAASGKGLLLVTETGRLRFDHVDQGNGEYKAVFIEDSSQPACIYSYPVGYSGLDSDGLPSVNVDGRRLVAHSTNGAPDGIHVDERGNIWAGHGDGVHVYDLDWSKALSSTLLEAEPCGSLIGKIILPRGHGVANFCWAGKAEGGFRLLLFAEDELWEVIVAVNGRD